MLKVGQISNKLTVIGLSEKRRRRYRYYFCRCECGAVLEVCGSYFKTQKGCRSCSKITHGKARTREYRIWVNMNYRCFNPNSDKYPTYGGAGITVCDRWRNSFVSFIEDMGRAPSSRHSIDRVDVGGNYEPSNCRWATPEEQMNNRRCSVKYEFNGESLSSNQWARRYGIKPITLRKRLTDQKWTIEKAIMTPVKVLKQPE